MNQKGFTLIELMIAMTMLAFISISTTQTIRNAISRKGSINKKIEEMSIVRDTLNIMKRDINMAFNHQDFQVQIFNVAQQERLEAAKTKASTPAVPAKPGTPPPPVSPTAPIDPEKYKTKEEIRLTHFKGDNNTMYFTTRTNIALTANARESDLQKVGYLVNNCNDLVNPKESSKCLIRKRSPYLDDEVDKGGKNAILLENITKFELSYFGDDPEKDSVSSWDSTGKGKKTQKNKFPSAVKIKLAMKSISNPEKEVSMELFTLIKYPNNELLIEYKAKNTKDKGATNDPKNP